MKDYLENNIRQEKIIDVFDELPLWSAPFGLKLLDYIDYKQNISILDIGFGAGFPLTEIAMRLGNTCKVYGIDPWKEAVKRTYLKLDCYGIKNAELFESYAENIPLQDHSIHLITSNNGVNNVNDIDQVFAECSRILVEGGQFVQTMNTSETMFGFYDTLEAVLSDLAMHKEIEAMRKHILEKRPSVESFKEKLYRQGFAIKDVVQDQFSYHFADGTTMLNHYFIRLAFMDSWVKLLPKDSVSEVFDRVELSLNEQAKRFGSLNLSIPFVLINAFKE